MIRFSTVEIAVCIPFQAVVTAVLMVLRIGVRKETMAFQIDVIFV